jgi:Flp pilus assembly protein TadG
MMFVLGVAALAIDIGQAQKDRLQLQNAADAAALAGSFEIPDDASTARETAGEYAYLGVEASVPLSTACGTDTACFDDGEFTLRVTTPYSDPGSTVPADELIRVQMCAQSPTFFGRIFQANAIGVCGDAVAAADAKPDCILCVLSPHGTGVRSTGAGSLNVTGGPFVVNSDDPSAIDLSGSGDITADEEIGVAGGYSAPAGALTPEPTFHEPIPDPLSHVAVPVLPGAPAAKVQISGSGDATLSPGIYSEIKSSSSGQLTLQPGIYVVTEGINLSKNPAPGKYSFYAEGVMIYFACSSYPAPCAPGESGATFSASGGSTVYWTPPTSGTYQGMSVFYDRNNDGDFTLTGNTDTMFSGTVYMKSGQLRLTGTSGVSTSMNSLVVVDSIDKTGDSDLTINYSEDDAPPGFGGSGGERRLVG